MTSHAALIEEIDQTELADGELAFWWLGQLGFALKLGGEVVYLDAYLSDRPSRTVRPLVAAEEVTNAAVITGSHDHSDHIDRPVWPVLASASPGAVFVVPQPVLDGGLADDLGMAPERFVGLTGGSSFTRGGLRITGVAAAHERLDVDPATGLNPYLGYVVESNGCRVYHAGDTCKYEGLETHLKGWGPFDVAFLPINGRDAERLARGCIGNMTYQEAVDLAGEIAPRLVVPAHFEMFADNSQDPGAFVEYLGVKYPEVATVVPEHGRRVLLRAGP